MVRLRSINRTRLLPGRDKKIGRDNIMTQETTGEEVAALWIHYTVVEKMTGAYSDWLENRVCDPVWRVISQDFRESTGEIPRERDSRDVPGL